jgi:O-methyltransferase
MAHLFREVLPQLLYLAKLQIRFASLVPPGRQVELYNRLTQVSKHVHCSHNASDVLAFIVEILSVPKDSPGCIVEAGCFKGGSTAKFSLFAKLVGRPLVVFDSFQGIPANEEPQEKSILGHSIKDAFPGGSFCGSLDEVRANVEKYGEIDVCRFVPGWFEDTMPHFNEPVCAAFLDVDLASSTKSCLKYLYPLLIPGGVICSQDGHFPRVIEVFSDDRFWEEEVGYKRPPIEGLRKRPVIRVVKPAGERAPLSATTPATPLA